MIPLCDRTVIAGKYRLERELAVGGMGAVWVARHLQLDEPVAVKFMRAAVPELADARARFAREARAAARLRGPHVVEVLDHGVDEDVPYIVMELLEGEHLGERLRRERRLPLRAAACIAEQVGKALGRAHKAGIVHRDLKPANVFLARLDGEEIVKILDFGIHKTLYGKGSEVTGTDVLMGSPQYMSPEQARGSRTVDHRADLWSLGAILYRAVTGAPAFDGVSAVDVIVRICTGPIPVASRAAPDLSPAIDAFFQRALARDPDRRFASARDMTAAFTAVVERVEQGESSGPARRPQDSGEDLLTYVMDRRASEPPRKAAASGASAASGAGGAAPLAAAVTGASAAEIDAFVERAFGTLLDGDSARLRRTDSVPPTTRCAAGRPPLPVPSLLGAACSPPPMRAALERLAVGSFGDSPCSPPAASARMARDRRAAVPRGEAREEREGRGTVSVLIDQGFSALRRGEPDTARRAWTEALDLDPHNRTLALNLRRLTTIGARR